MRNMNRLHLGIALVGMGAALSVIALVGQTSERRQRGEAQIQNSNLPAKPVVTPIPMISPEVTGPGPMFASLMTLPSGADMAHFKYEAKEYFVSGIANGQPYKTRIVVRMPSDRSKFSGVVLAEAMHPSGNAWMFHITHTYTMNSGHAGVEILTGTVPQLQGQNRERYEDLKIEQGQESEIIAQVGALMKSRQSGNPFARLAVRKMFLAGTSASAGILIRYLPAHMVYRLPDMKPAYDGFLPTSNGATIPKVDVPLIHMPTMSEVVRGANVTVRPDGDAPGDQYRVYEFAGIAHMDTRYEPYLRDPCKHPISRFPSGAYTSLSLDYLLQWVDKGRVPPRADRILVDGDTANDGSIMALDQFGNAKGGIRTPYVDVPAQKYGVPNEAAEPPVANPHPFVVPGGVSRAAQLCGLSGYAIPLSQAELKRLYKDKKDYQTKVKQRLDELIREGWFLPLYKDEILADAAKISF